MAAILLGDIVQVIKETVNPKTCGLDKFVGLEHYDAGNPKISRYGSPEMLDSTVKHFCAGDVLVARRNVYLKRAGYVEFEGVTSGDSIVLRVKDPAYLRILPFILNTEDFWDYAEQNSDGTMSKRLSPDDLLDYEFEDITDKDGLADKLWAAYEVKQSYLNMIDATNQMVKAKFVKMFGGEKYAVESLKNISVKLIAGGDKPEDISDMITGDYIYPVYSNGEGERGLMGYAKTFNIEECAVTIAARGLVGYTAIRDGKFTPAVRLITIVPQKRVDLIYLKFYLDSLNFHITGGAQKQLTIPSVENEKIAIPPIEEQKEFANIYTQAETSIARLNDSIAAIDRVIRSLINENL